MAWKCKECGSKDIICSADGIFTGEGIPNKYGIIEEFDAVQVQDSKITGALCNDCGNDGSRLEDIAEWEEN